MSSTRTTRTTSAYATPIRPEATQERRSLRQSTLNSHLLTPQKITQSNIQEKQTLNNQQQQYNLRSHLSADKQIRTSKEFASPDEAISRANSRNRITNKTLSFKG